MPRTRAWLVLIALGLLFACAQAALARPIVALLTDFGTDNEAAGLCHGAILARNSEIEVVDISHQVTPYDIELAALMLRGTTVFPSGTAIVAVIDPGVGTARRPIAIKTKRGLIYVGPDNGLFSWVIADQQLESVVELDPKRVNPAWQPGTFDGRDLFSPAAAVIVTASGDLSAAGHAIDASSLVKIATGEILHLPGGIGPRIVGMYLREDKPYGNLWTNISARDLGDPPLFAIGDSLRVRVSAGVSMENAVEMRLPFVRTFGDVPEGAPLAYLASSGNLAFAVNQGSFLEHYSVARGSYIEVRRLEPR